LTAPFYIGYPSVISNEFIIQFKSFADFNSWNFMWTFPIAFKRTYSIGIGFYNTANGYEQFRIVLHYLTYTTINCQNITNASACLTAIGY